MNVGNEGMLHKEQILYISYVHVCVQEVTTYMQV